MKHTVLDKHTVAAFGVASIAIRTIVIHRDTTHNEVLAKQRMKYPEGRIEQRNILDEHTLAAIEVDKLWTHTVLLGHHSLFDGHLVGTPVEQTLTWRSLTHVVASCLRNHTFLPAEARSSAHGPPIVVRTLCIERALSGEGDVLGVECINQRMGAIAFNTLPGSKHTGEIEVGHGTELQQGAIGKMKIDIAQNRDGTGEVGRVGYDHRTATCLISRLDGRVDGRCSNGRITSFDNSESTVVLDVEFGRRNRRQLDSVEHGVAALPNDLFRCELG